MNQQYRLPCKVVGQTKKVFPALYIQKLNYKCACAQRMIYYCVYTFCARISAHARWVNEVHWEHSVKCLAARLHTPSDVLNCLLFHAFVLYTEQSQQQVNLIWKYKSWILVYIYFFVAQKTTLNIVEKHFKRHTLCVCVRVCVFVCLCLCFCKTFFHLMYRLASQVFFIYIFFNAEYIFSTARTHRPCSDCQPKSV